LILLEFIRYALSNIWNSFSEKAKSTLITVNKILDYLLIPAFIYLCYIKWDENKLGIITFIIVYSVLYFKKLKQTKLT
jgi:hypothetical protein